MIIEPKDVTYELEVQECLIPGLGTDYVVTAWYRGFCARLEEQDRGLSDAPHFKHSAQYTDMKDKAQKLLLKILSEEFKEKVTIKGFRLPPKRKKV